MQKCDFSVSKQKYPFWENLVQNIKIVTLRCNLVFALVWIWRINGDVQVFCLWLEIPFLGKLGPKNQNCQFKLKFSIWTNSNMQNWMVVFTFSILDLNQPFWTNLVQKINIVSLSRHFSHVTKSRISKNLNLRKKPIATFAAISRKTISGT